MLIDEFLGPCAFPLCSDQTMKAYCVAKHLPPRYWKLRQELEIGFHLPLITFLAI